MGARASLVMVGVLAFAGTTTADRGRVRVKIDRADSVKKQDNGHHVVDVPVYGFKATLRGKPWAVRRLLEAVPNAIVTSSRATLLNRWTGHRVVKIKQHSEVGSKTIDEAVRALEEAAAR